MMEDPDGVVNVGTRLVAHVERHNACDQQQQAESRADEVLPV
jgi:hypothetical protein